MIKVTKNFSNIPSILQKTNRKEAFDANIASSCYADSNNRYKVKSVQKRLNKIYHLKCAYCEQKLLDAPKHIEHYRPKNIYYWLAYSWDNLLLACGSCNSSKSDNFEVQNSRANYDGEEFDTIHQLGDSYDAVEKPLVVNPEKEDVLTLLIYNKKAKISSTNRRVLHTIEKACNLNRPELCEKRMVLLQDFVNSINKHYKLFIKEGVITRFYPDVQSFFEKVSVENEFYSFRYYIIHNLELFFDNKNIQKILQQLILKVKNER